MLHFFNSLRDTLTCRRFLNELSSWQFVNRLFFNMQIHHGDGFAEADECQTEAYYLTSEEMLSDFVTAPSGVLCPSVPKFPSR